MADLKWVMAIVDKATAPAKNIQKSLRGIDGSLKRVNLDKYAALATKGLSKIGGAAKSAGKVFATELAPLAFTSLTGIAAAAGAAAIAFGKFAIDDVVAGEKLDWQLKQVLKDTKSFEGAIEDVQSLGNLLGADPDDIQKDLTQLAAKGHSIADAFKIIQGQADLSALGHDAHALIAAFTDLDNKGKLGAKSIAALGAAGLDTKKLREMLGVAAGGDGEDDGEVIEKAIKSGALDVADLQATALKVITETTGKELGGAAKDFADTTLPGMLNSLKTAPGRIMNALDATNALEPAKKALGSLVQALNPETATGQKFVAVVQKASDAIGSMLENISVDDVIRAVEGFASFLDTTVELTSAIMGGLWDGLSFILKPLRDLMVQLDDGSGSTKFWTDALKTAGKVIGFALGAIVLGFGAIIAIVVGAVEIVARFFAGVWFGIKRIPQAFDDLVEKVSGHFENLFEYFGEVWTSMKSFGKSIVDGIWSGITGAWDTLKNGWNKLIESLPANVAEKLKIHSPSRVMYELGGYTVEGYTNAINDNAKDAKSAVTAMVAAPRVGGAAGLTASAGGVTIHIANFVVQTSGAALSASDRESVKREFKQLLAEAAQEAIAEQAA